jgi:hypothetical protein
MIKNTAAFQFDDCSKATTGCDIVVGPPESLSRLRHGQYSSCDTYNQIPLFREWVVRKGRVIRPLASRFDSDLVVHGDSQFLLTAEVMLGRLDGHMPEQELDLIELTASQMTEAGTCAPQIVRCQLIDSGCLSRFLDNFPEHFRRHAVAPNLPGLADCPKQAAFFDSTCLRPAIDRLLHPEWDWHCSNMPSLAVKVGNHPMLFPELNRIDR